MKKAWRISVCALASTFAFSTMVACGDKPEAEERSNITAGQVLALEDSICETLQNAQSFSFGFSMVTGQSSRDYFMKSSVGLTAIISRSNDSFSAKIDTTIKDEMGSSSAPSYDYEETDTATAYIIDGFSYENDEDDATGKTYIKSSRPLAVDVGEELTETFGAELAEILQEALSAEGGFEIEIPNEWLEEVLDDNFLLVRKGDTTRVTLDSKKEFNDAMDYVSGLTLDTRIGEIINYALGQIDDDLTWQDITGAIKNKGFYTVSTLVNVLENAIYYESGMTLQQIKDTLFSQPEIYALLVEELGTEGADALVATSVSDILAEYGSLTLNGVIQMIFEDESMTLSTFVRQIEAYLLSTSLRDLMDLESQIEFVQMIEAFKMIRAEELNANLVFTVRNGKMTRVEASYNVKITATNEGESSSIYANYLAYAEQFSTQAQTISLPLGANVHIGCYYCGLSVDESAYCDPCKAYICEFCHDDYAKNG